jgi:hypothetical protein
VLDIGKVVIVASDSLIVVAMIICSCSSAFNLKASAEVLNESNKITLQLKSKKICPISVIIL